MVELQKEIRDNLFDGKVKKVFFKDQEQRSLWVRLNAEHIQYSSKVLNNLDEPLGKIGEPFSYMQISENQLTYDEFMCNAPRFSFEELVMSHQQLFKLAQKRNEDKIKKAYNEAKDGIQFLGDIWDDDDIE
jgi:hypothetical protein